MTITNFTIESNDNAINICGQFIENSNRTILSLDSNIKLNIPEVLRFDDTLKDQMGFLKCLMFSRVIKGDYKNLIFTIDIHGGDKTTINKKHSGAIDTIYIAVPESTKIPEVVKKSFYQKSEEILSTQEFKKRFKTIQAPAKQPCGTRRYTNSPILNKIYTENLLSVNYDRKWNRVLLKAISLIKQNPDLLKKSDEYFIYKNGKKPLIINRQNKNTLLIKKEWIYQYSV